MRRMLSSNFGFHFRFFGLLILLVVLRGFKVSFDLTNFVDFFLTRLDYARKQRLHCSVGVLFTDQNSRQITIIV